MTDNLNDSTVDFLAQYDSFLDQNLRRDFAALSPANLNLLCNYVYGAADLRAELHDAYLNNFTVLFSLNNTGGEFNCNKNQLQINSNQTPAYLVFYLAREAGEYTDYQDKWSTFLGQLPNLPPNPFWTNATTLHTSSPMLYLVDELLSEGRASYNALTARIQDGNNQVGLAFSAISDPSLTAAQNDQITANILGNINYNLTQYSPLLSDLVAVSTTYQQSSRPVAEIGFPWV